jgi:hypothetical protein
MIQYTPVLSNDRLETILKFVTMLLMHFGGKYLPLLIALEKIATGYSPRHYMMK